MESNVGYLEYEMCSFLHVTPKQLGDLREKDPTGLTFLERTFIHRKNEENKAWKKRQAESKRKKPRRT